MNKSEIEGIRFVERAILGSLVLNPDLWINNLSKLKADLFTSDKNRVVWESIAKQYDKSDEIDYAILAADIMSKDDSIDYRALNSNFLELSNPKKFQEYLNQLMEAKERRLIFNVVSEAQEGLIKNVNSSEIRANMIDGLESSEDDTNQTYHVSEFTRQTIDKIMLSMETKGLSGIDTGITKLNQRNGGFQKGQVTILAARAGLGKTTLSVNFALKSAEQGIPTAIFALEMGSDQLLLLIAEIKTSISTEDIISGRINKEQLKEIELAIDSVKNLPLFLVGGGLTINEMVTKIRFMKRRYGIGFVVVDYLQLIQTERRFPSKNNEVEYISRKLKLLSMPNDADIAILVLSQLSRTLEHRADKRPMLSDLRDSGAIEQDADMVLMLYRDNYYNHECTDNTTELSVMKNRFGKCGVIRLSFKNRSYTDWDGEPQRDIYDGVNTDAFSDEIIKNDRDYGDIPF